MAAPEGLDQPIKRRVWSARDLLQDTKVVRVRDLRVPIHIALGRYEAATPEELHDLITDLTHETRRRSSAAAA